MNPLDYYISIIPLTIITSALVLLGVEIIFKNKTKIVFSSVMVLLLINIIITISFFDVKGYAFNNMLSVTGYGNIFILTFLAAVLLTVLYSKNYLPKTGYDFGEFYILLYFSLSGMTIMATANNLIMVFLGIEVMSIPFYALAGFFRKRIKSNESSLKYFLLGAFATGFLLYGIALIYGAGGTTNMKELSAKLPLLKENLLFLAGLGLLLVGLSFKIAAFPFHSYAPDVYEGSPSTIAGFFSSAGKVSAFSVLIIVSILLIDKEIAKVRDVLIFISVASMIIGSVVAIVQKNIKRMLAYSSISHAGYILIGLVTHSIYGYSAIIFYSLVYVFMQATAFGIASMIENSEGENLKISDYAGLGKKKPLLAFFMAITMFSLAGIPPFGGFFGKYYIFMSAIQADLTWLAITGALVSVVSVYFYLNVIQVMYFKEGIAAEPINLKWNELTGMVLTTVILLLTGVFPDGLIKILHTLF